MANNGKGKSIYIGTEEEEWDKVLSNSYLLDLVLEGYGGEPIEEHGSCKQIPPKFRKQILTWLRKQNGYYKMLLERISRLEVAFKYLKDMKDKREQELKKKKKRVDAEGSGSNY
ncbi:hypothetical protein CTI12_AA524200 [Artemisia annua]|uniref:Uncharacterized protein n=1 Tax=Artemisia annua TaxID=35608 RepID=A0A2U1L727_ARTAN|nr:hypothetical protein CTI12_AA524200 [Artemisia annua]